MPKHYVYGYSFKLQTKLLKMTYLPPIKSRSKAYYIR